MKKACTLYSSPNGDRWYLIRDTSGDIFIRHEANVASGKGPEHQVLLRLIGSLVEEHPVRS